MQSIVTTISSNPLDTSSPQMLFQSIIAILQNKSLYTAILAAAAFVLLVLFVLDIKGKGGLIYGAIAFFMAATPFFFIEKLFDYVIDYYAPEYQTLATPIFGSLLMNYRIISYAFVGIGIALIVLFAVLKSKSKKKEEADLA